MVVSTTDAPPQALQTVHHRLIEGGLQLTDLPVADGRIHRVACRCKPADSDAGWYVLHAEPFPHGTFGCWRCQQEAQSFSAKDCAQWTPAEKAAVAAAAQAREREEQAAQLEVR